MDEFVDELYGLLTARAQSIGAIDVDVEINDGYVDGEVTFATGPDIGFTIDLAAQAARYCELRGQEEEQWLDGETPLVPSADGDQSAARIALLVLDGLLAARRTLIRPVAE